METTSLVWITPYAEELIALMARVSNPSSQVEGKDPERLIRYLIEHNHWSPFEMASACFEINTTRDIARQILRHRSFSFQEFSQRYADASQLGFQYRETRLQDTKNRQNSIATGNRDLMLWWNNTQDRLLGFVETVYEEALSKGIAKEVARAILPEGLTMSRMYMTGTIRSWIHYLSIRTEEGTQKEHREVAQAIDEILREQLPAIWKATR